MSAHHEHHGNLDGKLKFGLVLNSIFTLIEFVAGISSGSLALISDAGHNLTDSLTLLISFIANKIAGRKATSDHTYGFGRATILSALINGFILFLLSIYIFYESYRRFRNPYPVEGGLVTIVAFVGFCINLSIALLFQRNKTDLNIRSAYLNMLFDALASLGAMFAGILVIITGFSVFDSAISALIGIFLIHGAWSVVNDAIHVLLDGVPEGLDASKIKAAIMTTQNVKNVDDLHIWAISSHDSALSCHVVIRECGLEESIQLVKQIKHKLKNEFHIDHTTIETELIDCPPILHN